MAFPIFLSVIATLFCVTLIRGTCSGRTKAPSHRGRRHDSAVTLRLSRAHPRNIYQRAGYPRPQSVFNNGRRAMQGRIDFEAKVRRKAASNSPMCMCIYVWAGVHVYMCGPMDISPRTWSCLERIRLGMLAYRARNSYQCMENEIPDE